MKTNANRRATPGRAMWVLTLILTGGIVTAVGASGSEAQSRSQEKGDLVASLGAGGTLYAVDTRFDDGFIVRGSLGYVLAPAWMITAGVGRHSCFDCDRFWIIDGGVQWQRPGERFSPFVSLGGGRASDPGFMGTESGPHASVGSRFALDDTWGIQLELRVRTLGRAVGGPDGMGELTVGVTRTLGSGKR
jgi:hypothetical protein